MVKITISQSKYGIEQIEVQDHAADKLVCAAVSAVSYTLAGAISNMLKQDAVKRLKMHDGDFIIEIAPGFELEGINNTIMRVGLIGYLQLQKSYPDDVKVQIRALD